MEEKKLLDDEELELVNGGTVQIAGTSDLPQSPALAAANKKTIKEYKEYIIPSGD